MVVTRKAPTAPPPPTSRTNSSQPIPRSTKGKSVAQGSPTSPLSNGDSLETSALGPNDPGGSQPTSPTSPNKASMGSQKKSKKAAKKARRARRTFWTVLRDIFFAGLLVYSLFVCDPYKPVTRDSPPVCRAAAAYYEHFLQPYIIQPCQQLLVHPSVSPYVELVQPYAEKTYEIAVPVVNRLHVEWDTRVVPQWHRRIVPEWRKRVVPHIRKLERQCAPYRLRAEVEYERRIAPHVRMATYNLYRWQRKVQPYIILAAQKSHSGYEYAKPYAIPAWEKFLAVLQQFVAFLREQRRQFVDPHVIKLWERVVELSSGENRSSGEVITPPPTEEPTLTHHQKSFASNVAEEPTVEEADISLSAAIPEPTDEAAVHAAAVVHESLYDLGDLPEASPETVPTETALGTPSAVVPDVIESTSPTSASPSSTPIAATETLSSASSIVSAYAHEPASGASTVVSSIYEEIKSSADSLAADITGPSVISSSASATPTPSSSPNEEDEDDFADMFGDLDADEPTTPTPADDDDDIFSSIPQPVETEEEVQRRLQETAEKRRDIVGRHEKWEQEIQGLIEVKKAEIVDSLLASRKVAALELKESVEIQRELEGLVGEGEKYLKGAEGYLKKLRKEERGIEEKERLWQKVLDKVETKFEERVDKVEHLVKARHAGVKSREMQEIERITLQVKDLGERAQADVGMDYAWLDDVTTHDWTRYHDLIRMSENFTHQAVMIQDGTDPSAPSNSILPVLEDLESELNDIVTGFATRLRGLKRSGDRAFGPNGQQTAETVEHDSQKGTHAEPQVSILPVPNPASDADEELSEGKDLPPIFVGRGAQEVVDAMGRIDVLKQTEPNPPTPEKESSAEQVVGSLVDEAEAEEAVDSGSIAHAEL
ncbi:hypothetical protein JAAARDRAFT_41806 [Jaapia argillacea MUCL 33604]|uniref:Uncharacterized protein n=1 Tax=Jaapia argillacea MUCL 33604 TaxID=933084 RepID=A0A067PJS7_9AGAM|nr:hypothetical protein JAAARDRAFT_41806 [Jaapia argillacea MUCL 33604]